MIIRATTKEELREVLNYMCAQLRQTRVRVDLPRMGPPLHTGYDTVSVAAEIFPVIVLCNEAYGIHIMPDSHAVCILTFTDWLDVRP